MCHVSIKKSAYLDFRDQGHQVKIGWDHERYNVYNQDRASEQASSEDDNEHSEIVSSLGLYD